MREILFSGKRVDNDEWVEGFYVCVPEHYKSEMSGKSYIVSINNGISFEVIPETVREYTGLKDQNGKKIFERDIVTYIGEVCVVKWDDETAKFVLENKNLLCDFEEVWCNRFKVNVVIIGTIYDNPELLEGWQ